MPEPPALFSGNLDEKAMTQLAGRVAGLLKSGDCIALYGDLGAGKSTFIRAAIQALTHAKEVPSPTFTLVQTYDGASTPIWHFDLYRLKKISEVLELGWEEALAEGIVFVEWPERAAQLLPRGHLAIHLDFDQHSEQRRISIQGDSSWASRLSAVLSQRPITT